MTSACLVVAPLLCHLVCIQGRLWSSLRCCGMLVSFGEEREEERRPTRSACICEKKTSICLTRFSHASFEKARSQSRCFGDPRWLAKAWSDLYVQPL